MFSFLVFGFGFRFLPLTSDVREYGRQPHSIGLAASVVRQPTKQIVITHFIPELLKLFSLPPLPLPLLLLLYVYNFVFVFVNKIHILLQYNQSVVTLSSSHKLRSGSEADYRGKVAVVALD